MNDEYGKKAMAYKKIGILLIVLVTIVGVGKFVLFSDTDIFAFATNEASQMALEYYLEKYSDPSNPDEAYAMKRRYGCHDEIHVYKDEQVVMKAIFTNGKVYEVQ
ncbi:MAG: hypothetical protein K0R93_3134 [Anaerosolibacter sp.]|jgi:hypothetical protein|uniref:hypothetical protein n=1 Tax=Anaerosolibacter sp. TaxID=1872527 RepID=UPI0026217C26|nr:hypothetical protein [Anaerosolibacter sp.]MDF2548236.1 hypothetical protein [Anaerosolibacter sp.]